MDLFKAITGKNPVEYEKAAHELINTPDVELFKKLVKQDDFLFDFVKNNVAKRIKQACNKQNFKNIIEFTEFYSPSYDVIFAEILIEFGGDEYFNRMKNLLINGSDSQKKYALKYFSYIKDSNIDDILPLIREYSKSKDEYIANNAIEVLSAFNDDVSKNEALSALDSDDEFEQYNAIKFLVTYGETEALNKIIEIMKKSSLSENIASEILYLIDINTLLECDADNAILVLCNIINAIPEIMHPITIMDYNLLEIFEKLYHEDLTSSSALLLRMAKEKFNSLTENEEYLFDCDKNTKEYINTINAFFFFFNDNKLNSLLYDELYEDSDFVFFAVDYVNDVEELETLLDSSNQTLLLKVLTRLKEKQVLSASHKELALNHITSDNIRQIVEVL